MTTLSSFNKTDLVDDHDAADVNDLIAATLRSEYKNVETLSGTRTLLDVDTPIQRYECGAADREVRAPTENSVSNHPYWIVNASAAVRTITFKNNAGSVTIGTIAQNSANLFLPDGNGSYISVTSAGGGYDMLSILTSAEISITGAGTATIGRMHVVSGSSNYTVTLPAASGNTGRFIGFRFTNTGVSTLDGNVSETIDGALTQAYNRYQSVLLLCDGSNWYTVGANNNMLSPLAEVSITGATTATIGRMHIVSGSSNYTITLPAASGNTGRLLGFRFTNTGISTLDGNASETIDGVTTRAFYEGQTVILLCDGSNWSSVDQIEFPRGMTITPYMCIHSTTITLTVLTSQAHNYLVAQAVAANGDSFSAPVYLAKGTYTVSMLGATYLDRGKLDWTLDTVSQTTGQDWYSSGTVYNVIKTFTLTVPYSGHHVLKATVNGKNGSSSGYSYAFSEICIYPSAY